MSKPANPVTLPLADYSPKHFLLAVVDRVATVTLNRPERKNPLTFESYRELTDFFRACAMDDEVKTIVVTGAGGNFSSGGDVFEIIGPLIQMDTKGLTAFTRMTGDLVKAMRACPQPIVAAVEGICAGAGAIIAMASDIRVAANGLRRSSPLLRPTVSSTMKPLGASRGDPNPRRTAGSTTRFNIRKNSTSSERRPATARSAIGGPQIPAEEHARAEQRGRDQPGKVEGEVVERVGRRMGAEEGLREVEEHVGDRSTRVDEA